MKVLPAGPQSGEVISMVGFGRAANAGVVVRSLALRPLGLERRLLRAFSMKGGAASFERGGGLVFICKDAFF